MAPALPVRGTASIPFDRARDRAGMITLSLDAALVVTAAGLAVAALAFAASRLVPSNYRRSDPVVGSMAVRQYRHSETITTARHV